MKRKTPAEQTGRLVRLAQDFSAWHGGVGVAVLALAIALASRTISLSSFPYFPTAWPWNGRNGIYVDELTISQYPFGVNVFYTFFQIDLMSLAIRVLGYTTFAIRLVSALFSSITAVLVYLIAKELFRRSSLAFVSSLYFVFMTPALIYGRMAFLENGATTFFVATFLCAVKYVKTSGNKWLLAATVSAGLSFLCKQTGIVALMLLVFFLFAYKRGSVRLLPKLLLVAGLIMLAYFVEILIVNPAYLSTSGFAEYFGWGIWNVSWFNVFLTSGMPTGHALMWYTFPEMLNYFWIVRLDFWYVFSYFVIIYLMFKKEETAKMVLLPIALYALLLIILGHANYYYVALIQPFMAIPMGYGLVKLQKMSGPFAFAFSLFLCFPAIAYIDYYISFFLIDGNLIASGLVWVLIEVTLAIPIVVIGIVRLTSEGMSEQRASLINKFLLVFYMMALIIGSYVLPVFYPGYFAQSTVPNPDVSP